MHDLLRCALTLFVSDDWHDLPHLHRIARGNLLDGDGQLIGRNTSEVLEHRPQLLQRLGFVLIGVAAAQNTVECGSRSRFTRRISRTLGIREEDHSNKTCRDLHDCGVYPRDFPRDLRLRLIGHKSIFGDSGVQRHSRYPPSERTVSLSLRAYECPFGTRISFLFTNSSSPRFESSFP